MAFAHAFGKSIATLPTHHHDRRRLFFYAACLFLGAAALRSCHPLGAVQALLVECVR